jgi:hypothetical protein
MNPLRSPDNQEYMVVGLGLENAVVFSSLIYVGSDFAFRDQRFVLQSAMEAAAFWAAYTNAVEPRYGWTPTRTAGIYFFDEHDGYKLAFDDIRNPPQNLILAAPPLSGDEETPIIRALTDAALERALRAGRVASVPKDGGVVYAANNADGRAPSAYDARTLLDAALGKVAPFYATSLGSFHKAVEIYTLNHEELDACGVRKGKREVRMLRLDMLIPGNTQHNGALSVQYVPNEPTYVARGVRKL